MQSSQAINALHQSLELVERFAQCLLKDKKNEHDLTMAKQLGSFVIHFSKEIEINNKEDQIFEDFVNKIDSTTEKLDCDTVLNEYYKEIEKARKQLSSNKKNEKYTNFMKMVSDEGTLKDDSEIETVSETVSNIDPISKLPMVDPVKNKICGHTYDKASIIQLIERNPRTKCPIAGCIAAEFVKKSDLIPNSAFKRLLNNTDSNTSKKFKPQK